MQKFLNKIVLAVLTISMTMFPVVSFASVEIGDAETPSKYEEGYTQHNCLDLSEWNGDLTKDDFEKMKEVGIDSVILRAGFSTLNTNTHKKDHTFENNIKLAREAGFDVGVYYFSSALTEEEAIDEAKYLLEIIEPYKKDITLPVAYDFETNEEGRFNGHMLRELGKEKCTTLCKVFCNVIQEAGYEPMVYASRNIFDNYLDTEELESNYKIWLAQYTGDLSAPGYEGEYFIWQYTSSAEIDGIKHKIDANYLFTKDSEDSNSNDPAFITEQIDEQNKEIAENIISNLSENVTDTPITFEESEESDDDPVIEEPVKEESVKKESVKDTNNKKTTSKHKVDNTKAKGEETEESDEIVMYELDNSTVSAPSNTKNQVNVTDTDEFKHQYNVYKIKGDFTESETILANLLTGYFYSGGKTLTVEDVKDKIEPKLYNNKKVDSIEDISAVLDKLNIGYEYCDELDDSVYINIKASLAKGYPVIIKINPNTINWNGTNMILLLGMDENGKAIMADIYDRDWSKNNQRIKLVNVDEFISYTNGQYIYGIHTN